MKWRRLALGVAAAIFLSACGRSDLTAAQIIEAYKSICETDMAPVRHDLRDQNVKIAGTENLVADSIILDCETRHSAMLVYATDPEHLKDENDLIYASHKNFMAILDNTARDKRDLLSHRVFATQGHYKPELTGEEITKVLDRVDIQILRDSFAKLLGAE